MSDVNVKVAQYKKPPAPPIMRCASDAEKSQAHVGSPPLPLKLSHFDSEKSASNEIIDVVRTLPRRLLPKKQITVESDDDTAKLISSCERQSKAAGSPVESASGFLKPSSMAQEYKLNRRRSKTYSGEEFAAQLERLNQIHQQELANQNRGKLFSLNSKILNNLLSGSGDNNSSTGKNTNSKNNHTNNNGCNSTASIIGSTCTLPQFHLTISKRRLTPSLFHKHF
jgi:hypothetical protein